MTHEEGLRRLEEYRRRIDQLDLRMLELLNQRTEIVERIGNVKQELALPIYEPRREDEVYSNVLSHNGGPLDAGALKRIFERIIDEMRNVQRLRMLEKREPGD